MDAVRKYLNNPLVVGGIGFVAGLFIGLVVLGWWLIPVKWIDATPAELSAFWKEEFLRMTVADYGQNGNAELTLERYNALGDGKEEVLSAVVQNPQGSNLSVLQSFSVLVSGGVAVPAAAPTSAAPLTPPPGGAALTPLPTGMPTAVTPGVEGSGETGGSSSLLRTLLMVLCGLFFLLVVAAVAFMVMRNKAEVARYLPRSKPAATPRGAPSAARPAAHPGAAEEPRAAEDPTPIARYTANYKLGMDMFDESFSVETSTGDFLGEGGVGISEAIGVGAPKKVTAFEVWLFDKDDVLTVTKVLMSPHAYADEATRERLAARGEPLDVASGGETILETKNLYAVARVLEINYGNGALPPESYFDRFVLDMVVWLK